MKVDEYIQGRIETVIKVLYTDTDKSPIRGTHRGENALRRRAVFIQSSDTWHDVSAFFLFDTFTLLKHALLNVQCDLTLCYWIFKINDLHVHVCHLPIIYRLLHLCVREKSLVNVLLPGKDTEHLYLVTVPLYSTVALLKVADSTL